MSVTEVLQFALTHGWKTNSKHAKLLLRGAMERFVESGHLERVEKNERVMYHQTVKFHELVRPHFAPGT